jgi:hypothetical protein
MPPIPAQSLAYSVPESARKPGIVTTIGVMCIVIACLSAFASFISGTYSVGFYFVSQFQSSMATARATMMSASVATTAPSNSPSGNSTALPAGDAGVAVNAIDSMLSLDPPKVRELDRLMRRHGREVFGGDDDTPLTAATVRSAITSSHHGTNKSDFTTAQGTVEIFSDLATFTSADGSTTVRTSARHNEDESSHTSTNGAASYAMTATANAGPSTVPSAMLPAADIASAVSAAQGIGTLNAAQVRSLQAELSAPNQTLVTPSTPTPVAGVTTQPNGNLVITFNTGNMLILDGRGKVVSSGPPPTPNFGITGTLAAMNVIEGIASVGLAIYLLIVGIVVLRGSFAAPRMLKIYAWIKIPLALIAGVGLAMFGYALADAILSSPALGIGGPNAGSTKLGFALGGAAAIVFGLAFPVGLLLALRSKSVSEFYNTVS